MEECEFQDRGWAWVILGAAIFNHFNVLALVKSMGLVFVALINHFNASAASVAMIPTIFGASLFFGPVVTALTEVFTCRRVVFFGAFLLSFGCLLASFSNSLQMLVYAYGIIGACAISSILNPGVLIVAKYFNKRRAFANGILFSSSGIGAILGPIIFSTLLHHYTLEQFFMLLAGWHLHILVGAALYTPFHLHTRGLRVKGNLPEKQPELEDLMLQDDPDRDSIFHSTESIHQLHHHYNHQHRLSKESLYYSLIDLASISLPAIPEEGELRVDDGEKEKMRRGFLRRLLERLHCMKEGKCTGIPLVDLTLLTKMPVLFLVLGSMLAIAAFYVNLIIPPYCGEVLQFSQEQINLILSVGGGFEAGGRVFVAVIGDRPSIKERRLWLGCFLMWIAACAVALGLIAKGVTFFALCVGVASFSSGGLIALHVTLLADIVGVERLPRALGLALFMEGISGCGVPLLIGVLKDLTSSYIPGLVLILVCFTCSALFLTISATKHQRETQLQQHNQKHQENGPK